MKFDWKVVVFGIASLAIGYYLNQLANERNNEKLIAAFKAELEEYKNAKTRATTPLERVEIDQQQQILEAKINLLEQL